MLTERGFRLGGDENVLILTSDDGCTTIKKTPPNYTLLKDNVYGI